MLFSLLYFLVGRVLGTGRRSREQRDIELLVLRHQGGLDLATPCEGSPWPARQTERSRIDRSEVLGGLIHEYPWVA